MDAQLKEIRKKSAGLALLVHCILFLILLFTFLHTKIPPFGGGGGSLSSFGLIEFAYGDEQPMSNNQTMEPVPIEPSQQQKFEDEEIVTQDLEEAPPVVIKKENKKSVKKKPITVAVPKVKTKEQIKQAQKVDPISLYKGKSNNSSQGNSQTGKGDQGNPNGDPNASYTGNNGTGNGSGSGSGSGGGDGDGTGSGKGPGFELRGRTPVSLFTPLDNSQETGKVVVDITVDKYGKVTYANPGGRGSTTTNTNLFRKAKEAALKAKFSPKPEIEEQKGTITFVFIVQ